MSRVSINETTLTAIGDAIRGKTGKSDLIAPGDMPAEITAIVSGGADPVIEELEITANGTYNAYDGVDGFAPVVVNVPQDGGPPASALTYRGRCQYMFANGAWDWFINQYGNQYDITVLDTCEQMFRSCEADIPFDIKLEGKNVNATQMFNSYSGKNMPNIYAEYPPINMSYMFSLASKVKYFPEGFGEDWDWTRIETATGGYDGQNSSMFAQCYSLRAVPEALIRIGNPSLNSNMTCIYYLGFRRCYCLEKINNLHVYEYAFTGNAFVNTIENCHRLKDFTFRVQDDGTPFVRGWKNQVIEFTKEVGYGSYPSSYGFSSDKIIDSLEKYEGYVNDGDNPDGYAKTVEWATYNRKSAVRTINSLPDVSASGGTNTIKFNSAAASAAGEEYAMANLSEAEIAVAAAKGWTVTLV